MSSRGVRAIIVSAIILIACAGVWFYSQGGREPVAPSHELREAPAFALKDNSGREHRIEDFRGKIVLLHFWAAWCPPCLSEMPDLVGFARNVAGKDARIVVVTVSEDEKWQDAQKILPSEKLPADMVSLLDSSSKVSDGYGTYQFPETYLINPKGRIVTKWIGAQPWNNPKVLQLLETRAAGDSSR